MAEIKKVVESLDDSGKMILSNIIDSNSSEYVTYKEVEFYYDGTIMEDSKCDGDIYRKYKNKYFIKSLDINTTRTLIVNSINDIRSMNKSNIILINLGYYSEVETKGYYTPNDGGGSKYSISDLILEDDGFLIISNNINSFIMIQPNIVSSKCAGIVGDGIEDDTKFINTFLLNLKNIKTCPKIEGDIYISDTIIIDGDATNFDIIDLDCKIIALNDMDIAVKFKNLSKKVITGSIDIIGGSFDYFNRKINTGIKIINSGRVRIDNIKATGIKGFAVDISSTSEGGNTSLVDIGFIKAVYCGSISDRHINIKINNFENIGNNGSYSQRSIISTDFDMNIMNNDNYIVIDDELYLINEKIDTSKYQIFPKLSDNIINNNSYIISGGAVKVEGSDASCVTINKIDSFVCGIGVRNKALYPASIGSLITQSNGIGFSLGDGILSGSVGGKMSYCYFETNKFDVVKNTTYGSNYIILSQTALDLNKVLRLSPRSGSYLNNGGLNGISIQYDNRLLSASGSEKANASSSNRDLKINQSHITTYSIMGVNKNINIYKPNNIGRLYGDDSMVIYATGDGNLSPNGIWTITPEEDESINNKPKGEPFKIKLIKPAIIYIRYNHKSWSICKVDMDIDIEYKDE